ncbi:unnamed protein product [Effrenium voratum]|nr:unnamed protein product [Effrenium voratum]
MHRAAWSWALAAAGEMLFPDYVPWLAEQENCLPEALEEEPVAADQLKDVLPGLADPSGLVVFTVFVNTNDRKEAKRFAQQLGDWMCRVRALLGGSFLAIVDSEQAKRRWESEFGVSAFYSERWIEESFRGRGHGERHDSNYWRWVAMESILGAGYSAFYVDTDIMWLQDPRPHLAELSGDFFGSCDAYDARSGTIRWHRNGSLDMEQLRRESREHEDESVCCQGALLPVNAGMVMMRPTAGALRVARRCRERVLAGPCWGQAAMHWALFELCGGVSCGVLDPKLFASAAPLRQALKPHAAQAQVATPALPLGSQEGLRFSLMMGMFAGC